MTKLAFGTNAAVFVLFFGIGLIDALASGNLLRSAFWVAVGLFFLRADAIKQRNRT